MRAFVETFRADPRTRAALLSALAGSPEKSGPDELAALLEWTRAHVRFLRDPVDVEYVQSPGVLLDIIRRDGVVWGDCDDLALLYATLVEGAGYPTRFRVQGPSAGDFSHVVVDVDAGGWWVPVDPSQRRHGIGWRPRAGIGREAVEMRPTRAHEWAGMEVSPTIPRPPMLGQAEDSGGFFDGLSSFVQSLTGVAQSAVPLLERYGVVTPRTGYTPTGQPIYAPAVLPVGGVPGAAYQTLTQPGPLGLSTGTWLVIGVGGVLLLLTLRK